MNILAFLTTYLPDALNAIKLAQMAIDAGKDAAPHIKIAFEILFRGRVLTDAERAEQDALLLSQSATIQEPLP